MFNGTKTPWSLDIDDSVDWCSIRDADGRYVSDACVEGTTDEMLAIAAAIKAGESVSFKRCRAQRDGDGYRFSSPRNTMGRAARLGMSDALALADEIERVLARAGKESERG